MIPAASMITLSSVLASAASFSERLEAVKTKMSDVRWYPYQSMTNVPVITRITQDFEIAANTVLDIGAADGDLSFLFSEAGSSVDAVENAQMNFNDGEGLKRMNEAFGNRVSLLFSDIDFGLTLPRQYDFCLALGLAYHLRNVPLLYITLAQHCQVMLTNTRVVDVTPAGAPIGAESLAYFLERRELNDDPTNFWLLSPTGYRRVLKRCGWTVLRETSVGADIGSLKDDKRMWALCERVPNHADLKLHHDF